MIKAVHEDKEDVIGNLFEIELDVTTKNAETEAEPETNSKELVLKLSCFIDNNNNPIDNMQEGIDISLNGEIDKMSPVLGRDARYTQKKKINKLVSKIMKFLTNNICTAFISCRPICKILLETRVSNCWNRSR